MFKKIFLVLTIGTLVVGINDISSAMMMCDAGGHKEESGDKETVQNVGNKICPVSGEKIEDKTKATYEHEGKTYDFCCPMCINEFKKDPKKHMEKVEEEMRAEPKEEMGHGHHR